LIELTTRPSRNDDYCVRDLGAETIFLSPDGTQVHAVNELGTFIWSLLDGQSSLAQVRDRICAEYDVSPSTCEEDVLAFVGELAQKNLVILAP
jgi:hypothetical protein